MGTKLRFRKVVCLPNISNFAEDMVSLSITMSKLSRERSQLSIALILASEQISDFIVNNVLDRSFNEPDLTFFCDVAIELNGH